MDGEGEIWWRWVCALAVHLAAVQEMFQKEREEVHHDVDDTNIQTLDCTGEHRVMVGCERTSKQDRPQQPQSRCRRR